MADIFQPQPQLDTVRIRTERVMKLVSRRLLTTEEALQGLRLADRGIDPDSPSSEALRGILQGMTEEEALSWLAQTGLLQDETAKIHELHVYVDGYLTARLDML